MMDNGVISASCLTLAKKKTARLKKNLRALSEFNKNHLKNR